MALQIEAMQRAENLKRRLRQSLARALESHMMIDVRAAQRAQRPPGSQR